MYGLILSKVELASVTSGSYSFVSEKSTEFNFKKQSDNWVRPENYDNFSIIN